jgi:preprotein translocase subunit SecG
MSFKFSTLAFFWPPAILAQTMQVLALIIPWLQVIFAVLLIGGILLQQSEEGLGSAFGGSSGGGVFRAKRGLEKQIFIGTIIVGILFVIINILNLFIK